MITTPDNKSQKNLYLWISIIPIVVLSAGAIFFLVLNALRLYGYISLPVDLLSFSESPFVNDILKIKLGQPIYTTINDNNSYPYTPGSQILTYAISSLFGHGDSIPLFRRVQFTYVIFAGILAAFTTDLLIRYFLQVNTYKYRPIWIGIWFVFLLLASVDPRFNPYVFSLHNDGLALLISVLGYLLIVLFTRKPNNYIVLLMAILPSVGFLVKQSQLIWIFVFFIFLVLNGRLSWRRLILFLSVSIAIAAVTIYISYLSFGKSDFIYWVFFALGDKKVSLLRSIQHLLQAGIYAVMGLFGLWILVLARPRRENLALWGSWLILFGTEVYTSGLGFPSNHLGPGIVIGTIWFFTALYMSWPSKISLPSDWMFLTRQFVIAVAICLLFGGLGFIEDPRKPVPADFHRYIEQIEAEFSELLPEQVLLDTGSWIYLREQVMMRDRSAPVSLHVGSNQSEINREALSSTLERIENKSYKKILARQLGTSDSWYDFNDRGSGIDDAILDNYEIIRRIPGVEGTRVWWPKHLLEEVIVLVPKP